MDVVVFVELFVIVVDDLYWNVVLMVGQDFCIELVVGDGEYVDVQVLFGLLVQFVDFLLIFFVGIEIGVGVVVWWCCGNFQGVYYLFQLFQGGYLFVLFFQEDQFMYQVEGMVVQEMYLVGCQFVVQLVQFVLFFVVQFQIGQVVVQLVV